MSYGAKIKQVVASQGLTQTQYAAKIGLSLNGVAKVFSREHVNTELLHKTAQILKVPLHSFFDFSEISMNAIHKESTQSVIQNAAMENTYQYANVVSKKGDAIDLAHKVEILTIELRAKDREIDLLNQIIEMKK